MRLSKNAHGLGVKGVSTEKGRGMFFLVLVAQETYIIETTTKQVNACVVVLRGKRKEKGNIFLNLWTLWGLWSIL